MISLRATLIDTGVQSPQFFATLEELNVSESEIKRVRQKIAEIVLNALVRAGNTVVEDYEVDCSDC